MSQAEQLEIHHVIGLRTTWFRGWRKHKGLTQRRCARCSAMVVLNEAARDILRQERPKPQIICHVCAWENTPAEKDGSRKFYHVTLVEEPGG